MFNELSKVLMTENYMPHYYDELRRKFNSARNIVLFGAGMGGAITVNWIKENVPNALDRIKFLLDNNPMKWETELLGIPVLKPKEELLEDIDLLAITCGEGDVIKNQLITLGLKEKTKVIIPDLAVTDRVEGDYRYIWRHISELEAVYNMLQDDKSKKVFVNLLNFKICHDLSLIEAIYDSFEYQYFDVDIIKYNENDVFLDCGSYDGDTIEYYKKYSDGKFSEIYAFEADDINYRTISDRYKNDDKIHPIKIALWNEKRILKFNNVGSGSGSVSINGMVEVEADTIDNLLHNKNVDYIKMDIEGAEYNALIGGKNTIERYRPTLMISVYHKQDDFIRIPLLIKSIVPDYKLYFRHYRKMSMSETICYAVP